MGDGLCVVRLGTKPGETFLPDGKIMQFPTLQSLVLFLYSVIVIMRCRCCYGYLDAQVAKTVQLPRMYERVWNLFLDNLLA